MKRADVVERLRAATTRPLTLVRAPAGYGKTEALRQFASTSGMRTVWASPGATGFWGEVTRALPGEGEPGPDDDLDDLDDLVVDRLCDRAATLPDTTVLVLDGLDRAIDPGIARQLTRLVELLPSRLRLVVVTRHQLHLPTGRWRTQGRVTEIGADDLRFGPDETAALLGELGIQDMRDDAVQALTDRAEGWPAGVQLLATSLHGAAVTAEEGADLALDADAAKDLTDRTLGAQSPETQAFLLTTSVLGRFSADLCRAITGRPDAGRMLREADESNLFVVPLDDDRAWFRYQRLFGELLRAELDLRHAGTARSLRRIAAKWFVTRRDARGAVHQLAGNADDLGEAFSLVTGDPYDAGWGHLLGTDWSAVFPAGWVQGAPERMLHFAALLGRSGRLAEATEWLERSELALADAPDDHPTRGLLLSAQAMWNGVTLHARQCEELGVRALQQPLPPEAMVFHERVRVVMITSRMLLDDVDGAEALCDELDVPSSSEIMRSLMAPAFRARQAFRRGHLRRAEDQARRVLQTAAAMGIPHHPGMRDAQVALAGVLAERGEFDEAERLVGQAAEMADSLGWPAFAALYRAELTQVRSARWSPCIGVEMLDDIRRSLRGHPVGPELIATLDLHEARLRLADGELDGAEALLDGVLPGAQRDLLALRLALARDDRRAAITLLAELEPSNPRDRLLRDLCAARLAAARGDGAQRDRHLLAAARVAAAEGFAGSFLCEAGQLLPALRRVAAGHHELQQLVATVDAVAARRGGPSRTQLSEREIAVLRYLPSGMTHHEIAGELGVSANTVKSHVRSLYRKLGVQSRPDAVSAARRTALL